MSGNAATRRVTRSSTENATRASRRALGDVSNQASSSSNTLSNKPTRRSQRLASTAAQSESRPNDETTENAVAPRRSRRLSNAASNTDTSTQEADTKSTRATRSRTSRSRSRRSSSRGTKRSRSSNSDSERRKSRRRSASKTRKDPTICTRPCADIINTGHSLQRHPFDASKFVAGVSKHDNGKSDDPQEAHKYVTDIFQRLFDSESKSRPSPYIDDQPALNALMRGILIDWLVEVHMKFRLLPETLYLCVNILDRYLNKETVPRRKLQLVGVTALLLACKYEEIYPPEVKDCVYITDRAYTRQDVLDMEAHIVMTLEFRLSVSTGYPFLKRYLDIAKASSTTKNLANFYLERTLQEHESLEFRPSVLAAAAVSLAIRNPDVLEFAEDGDTLGSGVPRELLMYTGFSTSEIRSAAGLMERTVPETTSTNARRTLTAVKRKYESDRYDCVSTAFVPPLVDHLDES